MKAYQFGVKGMPNVLPPEAFGQLALQNKFWNSLVALEKEYDPKYQECVAGSHEKLREVEDLLAESEVAQHELVQEIKRKRQAARKNVDTTELNNRLKELKKEEKRLRSKRKELKQEHKEIIKPRTDALEKERRAKAKNLRQTFASSGLYWGNYNAVMKSFDVARSAIFKTRAEGEPASMNFHRFDGTGRFSVQFQGGLRVADLFSGQSNLLQIDPVPDDAFFHPQRAVRRKLRKTKGRIRVCSASNKEPIWLDFPVTIHRKIPEHALVKEAKLVRRKVGHAWRWSLSLVVNETQGVAPHLPDNGLAIDIGWRKLADHLRVAAYGDEYENVGEVVLDENFIKVNDRLIGLQSTIDHLFNKMRDQFMAWIKNEMLPEWMVQELRYLHLWRAPDKLSRVVKAWSENRFEQDREMFVSAFHWREKYLHLYSWQCNLREKMMLRRREQFRIFAKWVSENHERVYLEDFNLKDTARKKSPDQGVDADNKIRHWAKISSPGELRAEISRACKKTGCEVVRVSAQYTTITCPKCKKIVIADTKKNIILYCEHCGYQYDQDHGAVRNIMERGSRKRGSKSA